MGSEIMIDVRCDASVRHDSTDNRRTTREWYGDRKNLLLIFLRLKSRLAVPSAFA
jgi:hypothetical protein